MGVPKLTDPRLLIAAGIDPKTGLPTKAVDGDSLKVGIKKALRIIDEQDCVNRFTWYNLPNGIEAKLIERIIYYRGQAMLFRLDDKFYFLPYTLDGEIDVYGRFTGVTPLPFNGTANDGGKKDQPWIIGLSFTPVYDVPDIMDFVDKSREELEEYLNKSCVILKDYTEQYSQTNISRQIINDPILDVMAECFPYLRTSLISNCGIRGMRVDNESAAANVLLANDSIRHAALKGDVNVPIVSDLDFQDLTGSNTYHAEEYLLTMQSLDNFRLSLIGLDAGGLFQKKSHMLAAEQEMNAGNVGLIMRDSLEYRQRFCQIANAIWGTNMWCMPSETTINIDMNNDGVLGSNEDSYYTTNDQKETNTND